MFYKRIALLLCLVMLLSFAACGDPSVDTQTESDSLSETTSQSNSDSTDSDAQTSSSEERKELTTAEDVLADSQHLVGLCDQGNSRVIIRDLAVEDWEDDEGIVWEFKHPKCKSVSGIKFRDIDYWGGAVVLLCYNGGAMVVCYDTKNVLLHTEWTGANPHSVEMLPNGTFIVASSTDNDIRIYAPGEDRASHAITYPNAHGVLWDPETDVLWAVGKDQLAAIGISGTEENPKMSVISDMVYKTPKSGMHDLAPVYSDMNKLLVTCGAGIMVFDKTTGQFSYGYPGGSVGRLHNYAPGCGSFRQDDVFVFTTIRESTMVLNEWCTNQVMIHVPLSSGVGKNLVRKDSDDAYYKVRVVDFDYQ